MAFKKREKKERKQFSYNSGKNPPTPSFKKGYYGFREDYPEFTDKDGFKDGDDLNMSASKRKSFRRKLIVLFTCVFIFSFVSTALSLSLTRVPPVEESSDGETGDPPKLDSFVFLPGTVLSGENATSIINALKAEDVKAAAVEIKDPEGKIYFKTKAAVPHESLVNAYDDAKSVISSFKDAGIKVYAVISCFSDDIYGRVNSGDAAFTAESASDGSVKQSIWYDEDDKKHAFLSPYSDNVKFYLRTFTEDVLTLSPDGIIFENVCPTGNYGGVTFPGSLDSQNDLFAEIAETLEPLKGLSKEVGIKVPLSVMLESFNKNSLPAFLNGESFIVPEIIPSKTPKGATIGNRRYNDATLAPEQFTDDYMKALKTLLNNNGVETRIIPYIEKDSPQNALAANGAPAYFYDFDLSNI